MSTTDTDPDAAAQFDQFARERDATPDIGALVQAELARIRAAEVEREEQELLARLAGGPCWACGTTHSVVLQDYADENGHAAVRSELVPFWKTVQGKQLCYTDAELLGTGVSLDDWKAAKAYAMLPASEAKYWQHPQLALRVKHLAMAWAERPDGIDPDALLADILAAIAPPTPYRHDGPACPECGRTDAWTFEPSVLEAWRGPGSDPLMNVPTVPGDRCACGHFVKQAGWHGEVISDSTGPGWLGGNLGSLDPLNPAKASS